MDRYRKRERYCEGETRFPATNPDTKYREEATAPLASTTAYDDSIANLERRIASDTAVLKTKGRTLSIATWNVKTLYQPGKIDNVIQEMAEMKIDVLGLAETRWTNSGTFRKEGTTMLYSRGREHRSGVGSIMNNNITKALMGYWPISDRIVMIKLQGKPFNINIIQLYAPIQD